MTRQSMPSPAPPGQVGKGRQGRHFRVVSGLTLLILAVLVSLPFLVCHFFLDAREHVSIVAATSFGDMGGARLDKAIWYVASWSLLVFVVPVLALAGLLMAAAERLLTRARPSQGQPSSPGVPDASSGSSGLDSGRNGG